VSIVAALRKRHAKDVGLLDYFPGNRISLEAAWMASRQLPDDPRHP